MFYIFKISPFLIFHSNRPSTWVFWALFFYLKSRSWHQASPDLCMPLVASSFLNLVFKLWFFNRKCTFFFISIRYKMGKHKIYSWIIVLVNRPWFASRWWWWYKNIYLMRYLHINVPTVVSCSFIIYIEFQMFSTKNTYIYNKVD